MKKSVKSDKLIFIFALIYYVLIAALGIGVFSSFGIFIGNRIPPLFNMGKSNSLDSAPATTQQIVGSVTSLNSVNYDFDEPEVPEEEPPKPETDEVSEEETAEPDNTPVEEVIPEPQFYSFTSINSTTILHMRKEPSIDSRVIAKLTPGTKGYVMELGDDWSRVWADDKIGYCSNEFLSLTEISKDEIPEEAVKADEAFITGTTGTETESPDTPETTDTAADAGTDQNAAGTETGDSVSDNAPAV